MVRLPKIQCQVNLGRNLARSPKIVKKTAEEILTLLKIKEAEISLAFVDCREIKRLNKIYRGKNSATDVLSFPYGAKKGFLSGEIIICWEVVKKNAKKYKIKINDELKKILIHSLLHLAGYTHQKIKEARKMKQTEKKIFLKIKGIKAFDISACPVKSKGLFGARSPA